MTDDCIFCKIIAGELPADKVYEDDDFLAFEALEQTSKGHVLLIPKEHSKDVLDMNSALGNKFLSVTKKIGTALMEGLGAQGFNIGLNTKSAAGQEVFHTHFHLIPRYTDDKLVMWPLKKTSPDDRAIFAQKTISKLD